MFLYQHRFVSHSCSGQDVVTYLQSRYGLGIVFVSIAYATIATAFCLCSSVYFLLAGFINPLFLGYSLCSATNFELCTRSRCSDCPSGCAFSYSKNLIWSEVFNCLTQGSIDRLILRSGGHVLHFSRPDITYLLC